jgi:hypothetical protein
MERDYIIRVLRETGGVISAAAARLGVASHDFERHDVEAGDLPQRSLMLGISVQLHAAPFPLGLE